MTSRLGPVVGFDLDLTLIDVRPAMTELFARLSREFGVELDGEHFAANLGPPLPDVIRAYGFDEELVERLVARFRELYPATAIPVTTMMPGAAAALDAVRAADGSTLIVTGKYERNAALHIEALGWEIDRLRGDAFGADKGAVLAECGADVYVGDHVGDVRGAKVAGALAVAVATGPHDADTLVEAGADVVLGDLTEFPDWLKTR
ncbi:HAD family hydrolase [Allosaccharopolyspora coralli]|nr:HAD hydrolase-like protein [Allosaccharopolyspora coralli]